MDDGLDMGPPSNGRARSRGNGRAMSKAARNGSRAHFRARDLRAGPAAHARIAPPPPEARAKPAFRSGTRVVYVPASVEDRVDLKTEYLGLQLPHPFVVGASP